MAKTEPQERRIGDQPDFGEEDEQIADEVWDDIAEEESEEDDRQKE